MKRSILYIFSLLLFSCSETEKVQEMTQANDPHSYSNPNEAVVKHLDLEIELDFNSKVISGSAHYTFERNSQEAVEIVFDSEDLEISEVLVSGNAVNYSIESSPSISGNGLHIPIGPNDTTLTIQYSTPPSAAALQWLNPMQTADKNHPFLFTQSQAILARTWIPCQDSPGIRFTYSAKVKVPTELMALMSASNPTEKSSDGVYTFEMKQPIPSYLMALAVGDVEFVEIGERTGVYAKHSVIEKAAHEFSEMEDMLLAAEKLYGSYVWDRYDLIVLPPSFPFGGMENPRLTFATPTIIAGDKSLTSLVAHELAHSWSGNLVTNANWNDFWLNEGFTVYFEHRIMEAVYGRGYSEMLASLSYEGLLKEMEEIKEKNPNDTKLKLSLEGRDPDDGMTAIAYDKGYLFLRMLEENIGREKFDAFLNSYFSNNAFQTMTTERFIEILKFNLLDSTSYKNLLVEEWIYSPGLPANTPIPTSDRFESVEETVSSITSLGSIDNFEGEDWTTHEWLHFIHSLPKETDTALLFRLDEKFGFTNSGNREIQAAWFELVIPLNYSQSDSAVESFLIEVGRRKFLTPIYKAMLKRDNGKEWAKEVYEKARPNYHSVSYNSIDELLK